MNCKEGSGGKGFSRGWRRMGGFRRGRRWMGGKGGGWEGLVVDGG